LLDANGVSVDQNRLRDAIGKAKMFVPHAVSNERDVLRNRDELGRLW
jgi:hypothetical protein